MATTTPNFGWPVPTSTDLVKDGAVAIEALGDAVDASLLDLKGGTTGQVLAKATNTDMDFAWVAADDTNAIQNAIVDAKGDLIAASAADTPARLAVGNNGETLVADTSQTTGLRWQAPVNANPVLNSAMQIWQRGTSMAGSGTAFSADRWQAWRAVAGSTFSRQATGDTTNLPNIQYCLRVQRDSGNTATNIMIANQGFESINSIPYAGKTVTLSLYARKGANFSATSSLLNVQLIAGTGTDQNWISGYTGQTVPIDSTATLTTTWQRFTFTGTIASTATEFSIGINFAPIGTAGAADYFEMTGVQLEVGSVATPFKTNGATIQQELAACQRYLPVLNNYAIVNGYAYGTNTSIYAVPFKVQARVAPTGITVAGTINAYALNISTTVTPTFNIGSVDSASILASHTIIAGQGSRIEMQSNAIILFTGCEL